MIIVSDTSSLSNLFQIGLINILHELYGEITITPAVSMHPATPIFFRIRPRRSFVLKRYGYTSAGGARPGTCSPS